MTEHDTRASYAPLDIPSDDPYEAGLNEALMAIFGDDLAPLVDIAERLIHIDSDRPEAYGLLGLVAYAADDLGRSIQMFEKAHNSAPDCREYAEALASLYTRVGKLSDGLFYAKLTNTMQSNLQFKSLMPDDLLNFARSLLIAGKSAYHLQAQEFFEQRQYAKAAEYCRRHLQIERNDSQSYRLLGAANVFNGDFEEAVSAFHAAIHLDPREGANYAHLGGALNGVGRVYEALSCFERAKELAPKDPRVHAHVMAGLMSQPDEVWPRFRKVGGTWNRKNVVSRKKRPGHKYDPAHGRRIRIGYISADFHLASSEVLFIETLLAAHDRSRFEIFGYQTFSHDDPMTVRLQNLCDVWVRLKDIDSYTAALIIENDQCDVLVDLSGFSQDNRLDILGRRPSPVQVSWITKGEGGGVPGTDYVLSDSILSEADLKTCQKDQQPLVVEGGCMALSPFHMVDDVSPAPILENGAVTFGAVADLAAISTACVSLWCRVLEAIPGSRIVFGYVERLTEPTKAQILEWFSHMGMVDRVLFHANEELTEGGPGLTSTRQDFFSTIDVFLDGHPISNAMAIAGGLWMGVPAVTLESGRRSACIGASVLASAGYSQWASTTEDGYVEVAKGLADDAEALDDLRKSLRANVEKSSLFDTAGFGRRVESAYLSVLNK